MSKHDQLYIAKHQPGPLDAAIDDIKKVRNSIAGVPLFDGDAELVEGYDAAIRILEAANGLSRERIEEEIDISRRQENTTMEYFFLALLAALPDGGGE